MNLHGHVVICGWSDKTERIVRQLHAPVIGNKPPIAVIADQKVQLPAEPEFEDVHVVQGDATDDDTLRDAHIDAADSAIILASGRDKHQADARSILIALAIESMNPEVHTCVEVLDSRNLTHFARTAVNETISMSDVSEKVLAQAVLNHGVTDFYQELLTFQVEGNEIYCVSPSSEMIGQTVTQVHDALLDERVILIGLHQNGEVSLNPPADIRIGPNDGLWVIAFSKPEF